MNLKAQANLIGLFTGHSKIFIYFIYLLKISHHLLAKIDIIKMEYHLRL